MRPLATFVLVALTAAACTGTVDDADPTTSTSAAALPEVPEPEPGDLPGPPGSVLSSEVVESGDLPGTVHRVTYRSQNVAGEPIAVSGLVVVPDGAPPPGGRPVLAWAHGTTGIGDDCAPSRYGADGIPFLAQHLEAGHVVAATDYEGLGTPGRHAYLVSESEGRGVLDSVRAARELLGAGATSERFVVVGHSQGGHAALATAELASEWAPELELVGTAALAPLTDLEQVIPVFFGSTLALILGVYVTSGWSAAHLELDPADLLTPAGLEVLEQAQRLCAFDMGPVVGDHDMDALLRRQPAELPAWRARIQENTIHADRVEGPVLVAQGGLDILIPRDFVDPTVDELCAAGRPVRYVFHPEDDHGAILGASLPTVHGWIDGLLAGEPPPDDCGSR